ncbi:hypothetical protein [Halopseudomonas salina]|nr:hypothetical protein [Halopseudomonas salina]
MKDNYFYAASAYDSRSVPPQPSHKWTEDAKRSNMRRTQLHWGNYANLQPWQMVDVQLQAEDHTFVERTGELELYCDSRRWRFENFNKLLILIPGLKVAALFAAPWFFWMLAIVDLLPDLLALAVLVSFFIVLMIGVSGWLYWKKSFKAYLVLVSAGLGVAALAALYRLMAYSDIGAIWMCVWMALSVFMGVVGFDFLLDLYLRLFKYDGSEFNRHTGMVTIARRFRKPFVAPFYEFDATMELRPGPHGSGGMALWLHHRYADCEIFLGGKLHPLGLTPEEAMACWDTLQRYMDISQPLPDMPVLEQFRHQDPITAAYDIQSKRDPRSWRNMSYSFWEARERHVSMKRNLDYPWQQHPCILQARIDPNLSIETYYRQQEAKGIHANPKANDFDNIHRP